MEKSNKIQRSEVWEQIYKVVKTLPRDQTECDAPDAPSVASELEELFLKLLPVHDISNRRELFDKFYEWLDGLSQAEYDDMSLTDKCEKFFFKTWQIVANDWR